MTPEQAEALREPFPSEQIGKLPKANIQLDYVGHAAVTDRLLKVDPEWSWEPFAVGDDGGPLVRYGSKEATLWIRLTVCGVSRVGVGSVTLGAFDLEKQLVSDALRNAAMRFGVALDLWSKEDLHSAEENEKQRRELEAHKAWRKAAGDRLTAACGGDKDRARALWKEANPSTDAEVDELCELAVNTTGEPDGR